MLKWIVKPVESPYGPVATTHWAVPDQDAEGGDQDSASANNNNQNTNSYSNYPSYYGNEADDVVDAETALQVELESAEDQLGAVLWNSNTVALNYLDTHILRKDPVVVANIAAATSNYAPVLKGLKVVELGAGVGCLGIALAMGGASVAVTDLKELVPLMQHNITRNELAIKRKSKATGRCTAVEWKWGPSVSLNPKKYASRAKAGGGAEAVVEEAMAEALQAPSAPFRAVQSFLTSPQVDYVILCDALYGNPKDWPLLLFTLTEMLAANPERCTIVNFCEQRVHDVEGAFLDLLRAENACAAEDEKKERGCEDVKERLLRQVLRAKRGDYRWDFSTETVTEAQSELNMTIRATLIRWVKKGNEKTGGAPSKSARSDDREDDDAAPSKKRRAG